MTPTQQQYLEKRCRSLLDQELDDGQIAREIWQLEPMPELFEKLHELETQGKRRSRVLKIIEAKLH